jgi:hypothetical protein
MNFIYPTQRSQLRDFIESQRGKRLKITVAEYEPTRSDAQNDHFHGLCRLISKQKKWNGEWLDTEAWKRLVTAAWMRATGRRIKMVPAIDGDGFDVLYQRTSKLSVAEMAELIEFTTAWCVDNEIRMYDDLAEAS